MAAGLTSKPRWKNDVAFTRPYLTTETVAGGYRWRPGTELTATSPSLQ